MLCQLPLDIREVLYVAAFGIFDPNGIIVEDFVPRGDDNHNDPMVGAYVGERRH